MKEPKSKKHNRSSEKAGMTGSSSAQLKDLTVTELMEQLQSSPVGLGKDEARSRLSKYGYNELEVKKRGPFAPPY